METETTMTPEERNFNLLLSHPRKVNEPWLENQALVIEQALVSECAGDILGPSVTARFDENGFEIEMTVQASSLSEAYDKLGRAMAVIERVGAMTIEAPADEIKSDWATEPQSHEPAVLA